MLDYINIENSREGIMRLVQLNEMYLNGEINLEPCRDMLYYPISVDNRFMDCLVGAMEMQLKCYAHFLGAEYKYDYLEWLILDGREGYERVMLDIHQMKVGDSSTSST